jgi:hypothetical protein
MATHAEPQLFPSFDSLKVPTQGDATSAHGMIQYVPGVPKLYETADTAAPPAAMGPVAV